MKLIINTVFLALLASLVGCGDNASTPEPPKANSQAAPNEALNKARQVEGILQQGAQQEKQAIDTQTK